MKGKGITRQLFFLPALLSLWLIISSAFLAWLDPKNFLVIILFIIFASILCLSYRLRITGWILAMIGSAIYFGIHISPGSVDGENIRLISIGVISLLGTAVLCTITAEQMNDVTTQIRYSRKMIEEIRLIDPLSGLIRFHYARKSLNTEVARSQRYGKELCLIIARIANWNDIVDRRGPDASQQIMAQVGYQFQRTIRNTDIAAINIEKICVILPETRMDGAIRVAQRIEENCSRKAKVELNIGIACFPHDANLDSDLIRNAESALQISMTSGQPIIIYSQIKNELEQEHWEGYAAQRVKPVHPEAKAPELPQYRRVVKSTADAPVIFHQDPFDEENQSAFGQQEPDFPESHSYLSEGQESVRMQEPEQSTEETEFESAIKTNWVKPYHPPITNLKLESKVDGETIRNDAPDRINQIMVGILGLSDMDELPKIEKAFQSLPFVCGLSVLDYQEGALIMNISHTSDNFVEMLQNNPSLPFDDIRRGSDWLEVSLKG